MVLALRNAQVITEMLQNLLCTLLFFVMINSTANAQAAKPLAAVKPVVNTAIMPILFDIGRKDFNQEYVCPLDSFAKYWTEFGDFRIYLFGNTDTIGRKTFNDSLSMSRVASVAEYLVKNGIRADWIKQNSYGEEKPKYEDSLHQHLNRRVDIIVKFGLRKPKVVVAPVVVAKKQPKKQAAAPEIAEPPALGDTMIEINSDLQVIMNLAIYKTLESTNTTISSCRNEHTMLSSVRLFKGNDELNLFPKAVTYRFKLEKAVDKACLDTLAFYDADKSGIFKKVVGKVRFEHKGGEFWLKFKTRWIPYADNCNFWARLRLGLDPCLYEGNSFVIESPGYRINNINIKINDNYIKPK